MGELVVGACVVVCRWMILGGLPLVQFDRTGVAPPWAIALIGLNAVNLEGAARSVHLPTLIVLFALMVVSAQVRLGGPYDLLRPSTTFYDRLRRGDALTLTRLPLAPPLPIGALILVVAGLSAGFSHDIVCLAVAPVPVDACRRRRMDPGPFCSRWPAQPVSDRPGP
jgi:Na+/H+ antiporter NhaD/arsenite permease-like protein